MMQTDVLIGNAFSLCAMVSDSVSIVSCTVIAVTTAISLIRGKKENDRQSADRNDSE